MSVINSLYPFTLCLHVSLLSVHTAQGCCEVCTFEKIRQPTTAEQMLRKQQYICDRKWKLSHNFKMRINLREGADRSLWYRQIVLFCDSYCCCCYRSLCLGWPVINHSHSPYFLLIAVRTSSVNLQHLSVRMDIRPTFISWIISGCGIISPTHAFCMDLSTAIFFTKALWFMWVRLLSSSN